MRTLLHMRTPYQSKDCVRVQKSDTPHQLPHMFLLLVLILREISAKEFQLFLKQAAVLMM